MTDYDQRFRGVQLELEDGHTVWVPILPNNGALPLPSPIKKLSICVDIDHHFHILHTEVIEDESVGVRGERLQKSC